MIILTWPGQVSHNNSEDNFLTTHGQKHRKPRKKQIFKTKNGDEFNSESCRKIRGDIQKHMNNLQSLIEKLSE